MMRRGISQWLYSRHFMPFEIQPVNMGIRTREGGGGNIRLKEMQKMLDRVIFNFERQLCSE